jgi:hypothetical protein
VGSSYSLYETYTQVSHGFIIGDVVRFDTGTWYKALADSPQNAEVFGIVQLVNGDSFDVVFEGKVTGLSGLTIGIVYFLSPTTLGAITSTEPSAIGEISKPILIATSTTTGNILRYRGVIIS